MNEIMRTTLKERFLQLAIENGVDNPDSYKSFKLKRQLMQECPHLSFISQPGKSDLVCSSDISVEEALSKANELAKILLEVGRDTNEFQLSSFFEPYGSIPDEAIVHSAIGILRRKLQNVARLENEYYSAKEMTLKAQKEFFQLQQVLKKIMMQSASILQQH